MAIDEHRRPSRSEPAKVVLVGNPNAGKTSLFNALTGLRAKTANYPGITVDLRSGLLSPHSEPIASGRTSPPQSIELIDLPGMYGVDPGSPEERVAIDVVRGERGFKPDALLIVVDSTNLNRNLFLASELLELQRPSIVVLNMIDSAEAQGLEIDLAELSKRLECPVIAISARTGKGIDALRVELSKLLQPAAATLPIARVSCTAGCAGCDCAARHAWADSVINDTVQDNRQKSTEISRLDQFLTAPIWGLASLLGIMLGVFVLIFWLADIPMGLIESGFGALGDLIDRLLPASAPHIAIWFPFAALMTFGVVTAAYRLASIKWKRWSTITAVLISVAVGFLPYGDFRSLLIEGVVGGIAGVVVFLPQICILFFFITLLEDSGYMARGAFVMERIMRRVGLPGKAFVPMLSAHACAIPGIMAARTIDSWRDRLVTILVLPLLTCSARLPVYAMIAVLLFGDSAFLAACTFAGAYLLGLGAALFTALILKKTIVSGEATPLVIELPPYRRPSLRNAMLTVYDRASIFLRKAGTVILLISVTLWALASYPKPPGASPQAMLPVTDSVSNTFEIRSDRLNGTLPVELVESQRAIEYSFAGRIGKALEPVFSPLGFDWKISVGVVSSFAAREVVVSTLSIVYGLGEEGADDTSGLVETLRRQKRADGTPVFTTATSLSLLVFYVLAMQCLPTQAVTRRETGSWNWAIFQLVYMTLLAYVSALAVFQTLKACGLHV